MRAVPIPPMLKSRIFEQLAQQRGAWHRKRFFYATAAAACLLFAVGILMGNRQEKVRFNANELVLNHDRSVEDPRVNVEGWLAGQGIAYHPKTALNPHLLAFHGMASVQGKQVPVLYYRSFERNLFAQVYILRDTDFDLSTLPESYSGSSAFGHQIVISRDAEQPTKLAYVIVFTGDSLEPFLSKFSST